MYNYGRTKFFLPKQLYRRRKAFEGRYSINKTDSLKKEISI
jgi:hypothetical protein